MAADGLRAVARHHADDERAHHRNDDDPRPSAWSAGETRRQGEAAVEGEVVKSRSAASSTCATMPAPMARRMATAADEHDAAIHGLQDRGASHALQRGPHRGGHGEHLVGDAFTYLGDLRFLHGASSRVRLGRADSSSKKRVGACVSAPISRTSAASPRARAPRSLGCIRPSPAMRWDWAMGGARRRSARPLGLSATSARRPSSSRGPAGDEPRSIEPADDDGDRALVREGAPGQLTDGAWPRIRELLQHEELRPADAHHPLGGSGGHAQHPHDAADGVHHGPRVLRRLARRARRRLRASSCLCMGTHIILRSKVRAWPVLRKRSQAGELPPSSSKTLEV